MKKATSIFQFFRGALRGAFGQEDLRGKTILFVGMGNTAQEVLNKICLDEVNIYFKDNSIQNYRSAHTVCTLVSPWLGESVDVVLDFEANELVLKNKPFAFKHILDDAYTQGIHEYYL